MTVIELDIVIREMRVVIDQVARALELVLGVILLAGGLVLISGFVRAWMAVCARRVTACCGRTEGRGIGRTWVEFLVLGGLAGALASVGAEVAAWGLQTQVFEMSWTPTPLMWVLDPLSAP